MGVQKKKSGKQCTPAGWENERCMLSIGHSLWNTNQCSNWNKKISWYSIRIPGLSGMRKYSRCVTLKKTGFLLEEKKTKKKHFNAAKITLEGRDFVSSHYAKRINAPRSKGASPCTFNRRPWSDDDRKLWSKHKLRQLLDTFQAGGRAGRGWHTHASRRKCNNPVRLEGCAW